MPPPGRRRASRTWIVAAVCISGFGESPLICWASRWISRHPPRVVRAATQLSGLYARCTRFESTVPPAIGALPMTGLPVGLARLMGAERGVFARDGGRT